MSDPPAAACAAGADFSQRTASRECLPAGLRHRPLDLLIIESRRAHDRGSFEIIGKKKSQARGISGGAFLVGGQRLAAVDPHATCRACRGVSFSFPRSNDRSPVFGNLNGRLSF